MTEEKTAETSGDDLVNPSAAETNNERKPDVEIVDQDGAGSTPPPFAGTWTTPGFG